MFKKFVILFLIMITQNLLAQVSDEQLRLIKNDKEISISVFSKKETKRIQKKYPDTAFNNQIIKSFELTLYRFVNDEGSKQCEFGFIRDFKKALSKTDYYYDHKSISDYLKLLRINNSIDDILYGILSLANTDYYEIRHLDFEKARRVRLSSRSKMVKQNDITELFSGFSEEWPDDVSRCTYQEFYFVRTNLLNKKSKNEYKEGDLRALLSKAQKEGVLNLETYNKLHYLTTKSKVEKTDLWLSDYLKIVFNAKNKLTPFKNTYTVKNLADEDGLSSERIRRFSKLTRRRLLYRKYNETQIILLAQVLQKASRRMGVDPDTKTELPIITQRFTNIFPDGQRETYIEELELDSQSQYNLARRRMRKDILELQMMDTFNGLKITYQDIVVAAFETGYISQEDIEFVVKYDDLWNPSKTKAERIIGFIFTGLGYASFVVPPPWNITASVALGIVEGIVSNKFKKGADNDNPATFIE